MRKHLFKAKRLDNGEWVYGYLFMIWECAYTLWGTTNGIPNMIEVDPSTVCEFTGLTDKNGKEIFEDDVLQCPYGTCQVKHGNYDFDTSNWVDERVDTFRSYGWYLEYTDGEKTCWDYEESPDYFEIIGSIHDAVGKEGSD